MSEPASEPEVDPDIETVVLPEVALHLSARHFPVLLVTWFGIPTTAVVDRHAQWLDRMGARAQAEGTKIAILSDLTGWTARPGPDVRRALAASIEQLQLRRPGRVLGGTSIINEPVMRAVITMVLAITHQEYDLVPVKNVEQALARTFALLDQAGIPRPPGLDTTTYERPQRPR